MTSFLVLASLTGIFLVQAVADRPESFVPIPAAGRVYPAIHWGYPHHDWFYYTTSGWSYLSWSLVIVLLIAALKLAADRMA